MKFKWLLNFLLLGLLINISFSLDFDEDNEFAEFEVAEELPKPDQTEQKKEKVTTTTVKPNLEEEFDEFEPKKTVLEEEDEFEIEDVRIEENNQEGKPLEIKPLTFADIPTHFRLNWSSYQVEALCLVIIVIYLINYLIGKQRNQNVANKWFAENIDGLSEQFSLVGDDGVSENPGRTVVKETDYSFLVWSSGRVGVQGMLSQLKLIKRQDLAGLIYNYIQPTYDRVIHKVEMDKGEMDSIILAFGNKRSVAKAYKEMADLSTYAVERKSLDKFGLPSNFALYAELGETVPAIIDHYVVQKIKNCEKYIDLIHISDQFCGLKLQEGETYTRMPETSVTLFFTYNIIDTPESEQINKELLDLTFYIIDKLRRYRISREGKMKADKKRQAVEESFLKITHQQRQEIAQARREEKARERKQRLLEEEDPEKQRKLQKLEEKQELRARKPKVKQLKIK
uniref:PAT complex subunit CCDC47 n=1 Tax=Panagrolaimus sp. JU765 TaxID=591449 RepID=A0AC34Q1Z0_9BILA